MHQAAPRPTDAAPLLSTVTDGIALLTLNRPAKLNALSYALIDALLQKLDAIEGDPAIGAVILTGAGDRAFSAGADIAEFARSVTQGPAIAGRDFVRRGQTLTARLEAFPKPVIAAVNGLAYGGGCEITEAVHLSIASETALFAKPEIKLAMPPTFGGTQRLARLAGRKRALHLLLTGDSFTATQALEMGLINKIVPQTDLLASAHDLARRILKYDRAAIAGIIQAVTRGLNMPIGEGLLVEAREFAQLAGGRGLHKGLDDWLKRRDSATI
ncbi:MAG TPA: crotonase/enoyl-CoA hydratase family protein [Terriglobales bacterium]|nr:crotonase/enoyl-CoA hydratase family protein [Terriglobales bacterium]